MTKILGYIGNAIPYMLCAVPLIVLLRCLHHLAAKRTAASINWYHEAALCLFLLFLVGVASQTIIPKLEFGNVAFGITNRSLSSRINLIPGMVFWDSYRECFIHHYPLYFIINFCGNICLFLPIGFGITLLWDNISPKKILLSGLAASLFIELCQLPQARGTDIDDLWLNTLGALCGYGLYRALAGSQKCSRFFAQFKADRRC